MSNVTVFTTDAADAPDRLVGMLTHPDEHVRCLGRAFASGIGAALQDWLNAELQRGTDATTLLTIIADLGVQHVASVAAQGFKASGDELVGQIVANIVEERLQKYIIAIRARGGGDNG